MEEGEVSGDISARVSTTAKTMRIFSGNSSHQSWNARWSFSYHNEVVTPILNKPMAPLSVPHLVPPMAFMPLTKLAILARSSVPRNLKMRNVGRSGHGGAGRYRFGDGAFLLFPVAQGLLAEGDE